MGPPPLHTLNHPLIQHVVELFSDAGEEIRRETISGTSDPKLFKAKSGRWRGAVYLDPDDGQPWLVGAGLRREGEAADFYSWFCGLTDVHGAAWYLPTDEDRGRLRAELLDERLNAWEIIVHNATVDALAQAEANSSAKWELPSFDGTGTIAVFTIQVLMIADDDDEPDGYGDITIEVETTDYRHSGLIAHAEVVAMCAIDPRETSWMPGHTTNRIYSMCDSAKQIADVIAAAMSETNVHPRAVQPGECAHYAHKGRLTEQYVEGKPAQALCGKYFVPRQDPDGRPKCPDCQGVYRSMNSG
jgi:hypothetical protein